MRNVETGRIDTFLRAYTFIALILALLQFTFHRTIGLSLGIRARSFGSSASGIFRVIYCNRRRLGTDLALSSSFPHIMDNV